VKSFIKFCKDVVQPFYDSHGCRRYELFFASKVREQYFSYQVSQEENRYTEQFIFDSLKDFECFLKLNEFDPQAKEIVESYGKKFQVSSCIFTIFEQKA